MDEGAQVSNSIDSALREPAELRDAREQAVFLAKATRVLASSLEYEATLAAVAKLALPYLGTWCFVDLADGQAIRRVAIIHPEPEKEPFVRVLERDWPPKRDDPFGVPHVLQRGNIEILSPVTDEMLARSSDSPEILASLRALEVGSLMIVPLVARGEVLGAITYVSPRRGHAFATADLALGQDLGERCGMAIDHARLYRAAEQARAEAEAANRTKMLFLSTISHELRTPLNAIAGYAELLETELHGPLSERQREDVRRILVNERHLLGLVNSVLRFARLDAGTVTYDIQDVPVADVLAETEMVIAPLAQKRGISWSPSEGCAEQSLNVRADREKLVQILVNLVANAVKFSLPGGWVELGCTASAETVTIRITDRGIGIAAEHQQAIFEPFVQIPHGAVRAEEGTGLGLAISHKLAQDMEGVLSVQSELGQGSTFTLTLPRGRVR